MDVTTFMVGTEFARTMRSEFSDFAESGTDHNPLRNTILLGGKGIKGGMIAGASDSQTPEEKISAAHKNFDAPLIKAMGRPLDFKTLHPAAALPTEFKSSDYLDMGSVANTIYKLFGAAPSHYRVIERNGRRNSPLLNRRSISRSPAVA